MQSKLFSRHRFSFLMLLLSLPDGTTIKKASHPAPKRMGGPRFGSLFYLERPCRPLCEEGQKGFGLVKKKEKEGPPLWSHFLPTVGAARWLKEETKLVPLEGNAHNSMRNKK